MALIAEMGANTVRFAHYQHAPDWYELADRYGMIVWSEIPFVNKISFGAATASPDLVANARTQLQELIRSEEHTSELQSLMRISYAVFCLKKKNKKNNIIQPK